MLTITRADVTPFAFDLSRRVGNSRHTWTRRSALRVSLEAGGETGEGEASPLPGFSRESLEEASEDLKRASRVLRPMSLDAPPLAALDAALAGAGVLVPSARFALETALLDLRAKATRTPFWRLLADDAPVPASVPLATLLVGETTDEVRASADGARARGLRIGKLKVGRRGALATELAMLEMLAAEHPSVVLRLDANGSWTPGEAESALARVARFEPELVEEPVCKMDWLSLGPQPVPLGLDETLLDAVGEEVARELFAKRTCAAVVVKLGAIGGFRAAVDLRDRARAAGAAIVVTHMFDGLVATAAAAGLALAFGASRFAPGLDVRTYLEHVPDAHPIRESSVVRWDASSFGGI